MRGENWERHAKAATPADIRRLRQRHKMLRDGQLSGPNATHPHPEVITVQQPYRPGARASFSDLTVEYAEMFPFPVDVVETAITLAFKNKRLIADDALPRKLVGKIEFRYLTHTLIEGFTVPDTKVGRKSRPNEVSFTATETTSATEDFALEDAIPVTDIQNAPKGLNPVDDATLMLTNLIALDREIRVANLLFAEATYQAGKKVVLSGTSQWSDFTNSDPIADITAGLDALIFRPNIMTVGREAFSVLSRHPEIVKAAHGNAGDSGIAARDDLARIFELDKVLVGEGFVNTAAKGQPINLVRVWGKHCALSFIDNDSGSNTPTFGFTASYLGRVAGSFEDKNIGMRGGTRVRVGESVKEVITAADLGYFIEDAVA